MNNTLIAFDLDDTLYREWDFVASGYRAVSQALAQTTGADAATIAQIITAGRPRGFEDALSYLADRPGIENFSVESMIEIYRAHKPDISLGSDVLHTLQTLKARQIPMALITDGSTRHQRSKIQALGLYDIFEPEFILISEETGGDKHTTIPWERARRLAGGTASRYIYVGDNMAKDFRLPRQQGWYTILLRGDGGNVFSQRPADFPPENRPNLSIFSLSDILNLPQLKTSSPCQ